VRDLENGTVAASLDGTGLVASALTGMAGPPAGPAGPARPARPVAQPRVARPSASPLGGPPAGQSRRGRTRRSGPPGGPAAQVPYLIVLCGVIAGLALIWQGAHYVRPGTLTVAGALFVAATARLILPEQRAGLLASRRRAIDVTALAILAAGLLVAGLVLPIPW
jgi:Protein of unknown function (DUF3017)